MLFMFYGFGSSASQAEEQRKITYEHSLRKIENPEPILADYPEYIEPLQYETRYLAPPVVNEEDGELLVRSWRYWYHVRGIVEMENRLEAKATAIMNLHPWGVDDGHGLKTPEPNGVVLFCARFKNDFSLEHIKDVVNPFMRRLRPHIAVVVHSLTTREDGIRKLLYPSISTTPEELDVALGEKLLAELLGNHKFEGQPLISKLTLDAQKPLPGYFEQTPPVDAGDYYNGPGFWELPMPIVKGLDFGEGDIVMYDDEGYPKIRDYLKSKGVRHILMVGHATDVCIIHTTCGYLNMNQDFNVFLVGDATLATYPASTTPKYSTQAVLADAALNLMITQVSWVKFDAEMTRKKQENMR